jgi:2-pyrone-4,6-dicarboxylate lactonase
VTQEFPPFDRNTRAPRIPPPPDSCDTHMHVYGDAARYPAQKTNHLYSTPDARLGDYLKMRRTIGFARSVFVQPTIYGTDHSFFKDTLRAVGDVENFRGVALVDDTLSDAALEELHGLGVRCARFIFRANLGMRPSLESFRRSLARVKELGWFVKIFGMAQDAVDLADELRKIEVTAVIDHMWRLVPGDPVSAQAFGLVRELLQSENWWVQISNGDRSSLQPEGWSDVVTYGRALYEAAPDRCIWGSDWPHAEYRKPSVPNDGALVDLLSDYLPDEESRTKVLVTNPARLFGFGNS